jgi:hypothetical protein
LRAKRDWTEARCGLLKNTRTVHLNFTRSGSVPCEGRRAAVLDAERRAKCLDLTGCDHGRDPSSGVWKLVLMMMAGGQIP